MLPFKKGELVCHLVTVNYIGGGIMNKNIVKKYHFCFIGINAKQIYPVWGVDTATHWGNRAIAGA